MLLSQELFTTKQKAQEMPSIVYHYCSLDSFLSILETNSLRLSNITKSNDPTEIINVIPILEDVTKTVLLEYNQRLLEHFRFKTDIIENLIGRFFDELSQNFYVICFSEKRDLLSQWDRYADKATGVAIGFNTRHFVKLQVETSSQYVFGKIIYDQQKLADSVKSFLHKQISSCWKSGNDLYNVNLIENATINMVCTVLQYAVLFKKEFFSEESEWRLIYNPLGRIRRLGYASAYHDRLLETNQYRYEESGFTRQACKFRVCPGNGISSYVDLDFSAIRGALIQEILLGPKSSIEPTDKDLQLLLAFHGYKLSSLTVEGRLVLSKSDNPFR